MGRKKVSSSRVPDKVFDNLDEVQIKASIRKYNYENEKVIFDFSFEGAFVSCKCGSFDNYLHDEEEFASKFACAEKNIIKLSQHTLKELSNVFREIKQTILKNYFHINFLRF